MPFWIPPPPPSLPSNVSYLQSVNESNSSSEFMFYSFIIAICFLGIGLAFWGFVYTIFKECEK